jgi:tRNA (guanine10-N2)-methyltransferase
LIEFAYKHVDFQRAELESVLESNGIVLRRRAGAAGGARPGSSKAASWCRVVPLPGPPPSGGASSPATSSPHALPRPFVVLDVGGTDDDTDVATRIGRRLVEQCTLVRSVMELWGMGRSVSSCAESVRMFVAHRRGTGAAAGAPGRIRQRCYDGARQSFEPDKSWKFTVHGMGYSFSGSEQEGIRSQFRFLGFQGPVQMKEPDNEFVFLQEARLDAAAAATNVGCETPSGSEGNETSTCKILDVTCEAKGGTNAGTEPPTPPSPSRDRSNSNSDTIETDNDSVLACYFGRTLGEARSTKNRSGLSVYTLKKRAYLGPTSMDAELAFVMANLGKVGSGSVVYDPFVGTGSILVACALRGAGHVVGSDIDVRVLRGKGPDRNVGSNFAQFGLPRPELVRTDNAIYRRHYRSHRPLYDAIVTDPPYGIRAGARKCGSKLDQPRPVSEDQRSTHIPQTRCDRIQRFLL